MFGEIKCEDMKADLIVVRSVVGLCAVYIWNCASLTFKIANALTDQVQYLTISGSSFVLRNVVKFIMQFRVDLNAEMLVVFVSHVM